MDRASATAALILGLIAAGSAGIWPRPSHAASVSDTPGRPFETIKHYEVRGVTLDGLRNEVFSRGPADAKKRQRFAGWTDWEIRWRFEYEESPRSCRLQDVSTEAHVVYTLPLWVDRAKASNTLQEAWDRFSNALTEHEKGHGQIAYKLAKRIEDEMRTIPAQPTCAELERRINDLGSRMIDEDSEQEAYDRVTGHGETQGAAFPRTIVRARITPQASND
jgi:predicted secreted Zn-dependent protease